MLNSELQKVIGLTQKGNYKDPSFHNKLDSQKMYTPAIEQSPKSHTQNISSKNQLKICCIIMWM